MRRVVLLIFATLWAFAALGQQHTVTGVVTSAEDGQPLPQLSVALKGTTQGVVTDLEGRYRITVPGPEAVLQFVYMGMATQEITVGDRTELNVVMQPGDVAIGQAVVMGYGTRTKNQLTGSTVQVGGEKLAELPVASPLEALQGKVPGLVTNTTSGTAGSSQQVMVRGIGSLAAGTEPLYVVDGVPIVNYDVQASAATSSMSTLASLNLSDIESVTLLKDASATAAYGARGSNGVLVITTKRGKTGETQFNFAGYYGFQQVATPWQQLMTGQEQLESFGAALRNADFFAKLKKNKALNDKYLSGQSLSESEMGAVNAIWEALAPVSQYVKKDLEEDYPIIKRWVAKGRPNYDVRKAWLRNMAHTFNGQLSAQGGGDGYSYYTSLGGNYTQNLAINSDYKKLTGTLNFTRSLTSWLKFETQNKLAYNRQDGITAEQSSYYSNPYRAWWILDPWTSPYDSVGKPNLVLPSTLQNYEYVSKHSINWQDMVRGITSNSLTATIIPGLKYKTLLSLDYYLANTKQYYSRLYAEGKKVGGIAVRNEMTNYNYVTQNSLSYDFTFLDDHALSLMVLMEYQRNHYTRLGGSGYGVPHDKLNLLSSTSSNFSVNESDDDWSNVAYLGMANYSYLGRYILDLTYRREGSSNFPTDKRYGNFGSIGLAWNIHTEPFFEPIVGVINNLKLRGSWGVSGNSDITRNSYQSLLDFGATYNQKPAGLLSGYGNPNLTWEKNSTFDIGLDFGVLEDRISGSVSFYYKQTTDLLQNVPLSRTQGFSTVLMNVGAMNNRGVEALLEFAILRNKNYHLNLGFNIATIRNRVTKLAKDAAGTRLVISSNWKRTDENHKISEWYLREYAGVNPQTGLPMWWKDSTHQEKTSDASKAKKHWTGYSSVPTYSGGVTLHADAWGVYMDANLYFAGGHRVVSSPDLAGLGDNASSIAKGHAPKKLYGNMWQKPGDQTKYPVYAYNANHRYVGLADNMLRRGDYVRLKDLTLGYHIPRWMLDRIKYPGTISIYARGTNLFTHAFDPEVDFDPEVRLDGFADYYAPVFRTISFGINMNF